MFIRLSKTYSLIQRSYLDATECLNCVIDNVFCMGVKLGH